MNTEIVYIKYLNKSKNFTEDSIEFKGSNAYSDAVKWGRKNLSNFSIDMINYK